MRRRSAVRLERQSRDGYSACQSISWDVPDPTPLISPAGWFGVWSGRRSSLKVNHTLISPLSSLVRRGLAATQDMEEASFGKSFSEYRRERSTCGQGPYLQYRLPHRISPRKVAKRTEWSRSDRAIIGLACDPLAPFLA